MNKTWTLIADAESAAWRAEIAKKYPLVSPHRIARLCMKYGLRAAAMCPEILIEEAAGEPSADNDGAQQ